MLHSALFTKKNLQAMSNQGVTLWSRGEWVDVGELLEDVVWDPPLTEEGV